MPQTGEPAQDLHKPDEMPQTPIPSESDPYRMKSAQTVHMPNDMQPQATTFDLPYPARTIDIPNGMPMSQTLDPHTLYSVQTYHVPTGMPQTLFQTLSSDTSHAAALEPFAHTFNKPNDMLQTPHAADSGPSARFHRRNDVLQTPSQPISNELDPYTLYSAQVHMPNDMSQAKGRDSLINISPGKFAPTATFLYLKAKYQDLLHVAGLDADFTLDPRSKTTVSDIRHCSRGPNRSRAYNQFVPISNVHMTPLENAQGLHVLDL
jgi:hypothetical protein